MQIKEAKTKIYYIDNLRVLLTVLVVFHHVFVMYGAPGSWYYKEPTTKIGALAPMTMFVATNQAFFMGFFFFLSALFTESSYIKKGAAKFTADRLKRLGIPLLFYSFIFSPILNFLVYHFGHGGQATFMQYLGGYDDWVDPGVMWFVLALLVFTIMFIIVQQFGSNSHRRQYKFPSNTAILLFALALGVISYLVRIVFPVGRTLKPLGFQLGHFTQYIAMFMSGIIASRSGWLNSIELKTGRRWLIVAVILVLVIFPLFYVVKELTKSPLDAFQGNGTWQSLLSAVWEQLTGISIMVALLGITRFRWNKTSPLLTSMARGAYATYILHPLLVITMGLLLKDWSIDPSLKIFIAAPVAVTGAFFIGWVATRIPGVRNIV